MKKHSTILILMFTIMGLQSCIVSSRPSIDYFKSKEMRKSHEFVSINIPTFLAKTVMKSKLRNDGESEALINLVKKFSKIKIMTSTSLKTENISSFNAYLEKQSFEDWASIKSDGEVIRIKAKKDRDIIKNLMLIISSSNSEAVFIDVSGRFTPEDISLLINSTQEKKINLKFD